VKVLHHRDRIEATGGVVLAVGFEKLDRMVRGLDWPWPILLDRDHAAYERCGLGRAPVTELLKPSGWMRGYIREVREGNVRGAVLSRPGRDMLQLGGDFVIDADGIVALAHPSAEIDDRAPVGALVKALSDAAGVSR
jgi:AhpC/TSA antioxidant enzyme